MIRQFQAEDLDAVMAIWLRANIEAHNFVDPGYWEENFGAVKSMIPQAEVYVSEDSAGINGFIGVMDSYIAGLFVESTARAHGIGSQLLNFVKEEKEALSLHVYQKNMTAVSFYLSRVFQIDAERIDPQISELEYTMRWER